MVMNQEKQFLVSHHHTDYISYQYYMVEMLLLHLHKEIAFSFDTLIQITAAALIGMGKESVPIYVF